MKKLFIIAVLMISVGMANAQKIKERVVDKFNGSVMIRTTDESLFKTLGFTNLDVFARKIKSDTATYNSISFLFGAVSALSLRSGDSAYFKFTDGSVTTLPYMFRYDFYGSKDIVYFTCELSEDAAKLLIQNQISDIRFTNSSYNRDFVIKEKYRQVVPNICKLILAEN